ncbi:unnamed protein product [Lathyrus oleraceus]|uniref:Lysine ketoglutarate reductase trans-splicing-like protein n=1 Tax=Pisum sativum TaxID=3888 RepID=A0A9D5H1C3_PEA|nr:uncharacterized protein LOC127086228 [Pisum sativum]KAI5448711.1 hypothetical protein KIW84_015922 [Pisum sativum]
MKGFDSVTDPKNRFFLWTILVLVSLICAAYFLGNGLSQNEYKQRFARWGLIYSTPITKSNACKTPCRHPSGTHSLPHGILATTSDLETRPLWASAAPNNRNSKHPLNLLAIPVGIKQRQVVDKIVKKFPSSDFVVMLFHYDGFVDGWKDLAWSSRAIHVSAINQTKWWFAKRFLHPDIVADYNYIFLWDEDLLVDNFDPKRYIDIVKEEGLEISQPALDPGKSEIYHPLTARIQGSKAHRRYYKTKGSGRCDDSSTAPPCVGWVEMMAPVFSKKAWPCVWHMIQNDLIHAWGLDRQFGYCAQGDRMKNIGVVDAEYIVHLGLPTLGGSNGNETLANSHRDESDRPKVRMQSYIEMQIFAKRWKDAANKDQCWIDPYQEQAN